MEGILPGPLGVVDAQGRFQLTCKYNGQPGAVAGPHVVLVEEPPLPDEVRQSPGARAADQYREKLGNRPIPPKYGSVSGSPLKVEVKDGQAEYNLELQR